MENKENHLMMFSKRVHNAYMLKYHITGNFPTLNSLELTPVSRFFEGDILSVKSAMTLNTKR